MREVDLIKLQNKAPFTIITIELMKNLIELIKYNIQLKQQDHKNPKPFHWWVD